MPQFAVYRNADRTTRRVFPWLVDVQVDVLGELDTRVVVPLVRAAAPETFPMRYLTPTVTFERRSYVLMTPQLAGIARAELGPHAGSVAEHANAIATAVEFLVRGFG